MNIRVRGDFASMLWSIFKMATNSMGDIIFVNKLNYYLRKKWENGGKTVMILRIQFRTCLGNLQLSNWYEFVRHFYLLIFLLFIHLICSHTDWPRWQMSISSLKYYGSPLQPPVHTTIGRPDGTPPPTHSHQPLTSPWVLRERLEIGNKVSFLIYLSG